MDVKYKRSLSLCNVLGQSTNHADLEGVRRSSHSEQSFVVLYAIIRRRLSHFLVNTMRGSLTLRSLSSNSMMSIFYKQIVQSLLDEIMATTIASLESKQPTFYLTPLQISQSTQSAWTNVYFNAICSHSNRVVCCCFWPLTLLRYTCVRGI